MNLNPTVFVVIPCLAEESIWETIKSLSKNSGFSSKTECIIVVNHAEQESEQKKNINHQIIKSLKNNLHEYNSEFLQFNFIEAFDLPHKKAGVGMARKIGMDSAIEKLKIYNQPKEGILICLDGDCIVAENYLSEIEKHFEEKRSNGCSIYFEHPLDKENSEGIIEYELYLRFYIAALRWCGFPLAFQTVGSSMAVSATSYLKQGGMNTRKAGEDFYFLNKIIQLENFGDLTTTTVYPSPRNSDRVPFGTGREMMEWNERKYLEAYSPELIKQLKIVFDYVDQYSKTSSSIELLNGEIDKSVYDFLINLEFNTHIEEIKQHTASAQAFRKRFFNWMNAFQIMKLLNELSQSSFRKVHVQEAASWLLNQLQVSSSSTNAKDLLMTYRAWDRTNARQI